jgi:hypothetical protein
VLSPVDVHLVVGWLYAAHEGREVPVVLGERVHDVTTGTERDVDIVYASTSEMGLVGVEVKGEKRPLDTPMVEQICQKLADMPSLNRRCLVSGSGFTETAVKKAAAHGLECLRFLRGRLPRLGNVDLSHLRKFPVTYTRWADPQVTFLPRQAIPLDVRERFLAYKGPLRYLTDGSGDRPQTLQQLADFVTRTITGKKFPETEGLFEQLATIDDAPSVEIDGHILVVEEALFRATVRFETEVLGLDDCGYLETLDGRPLAAAVVIPIETGLLGIYVSSAHQQTRLVHIPHVGREKRPFKLVLHPGHTDDRRHD